MRERVQHSVLRNIIYYSVFNIVFKCFETVSLIFHKCVNISLIERSEYGMAENICDIWGEGIWFQFRKRSFLHLMMLVWPCQYLAKFSCKKFLKVEKLIHNVVRACVCVLSIHLLCMFIVQKTFNRIQIGKVSSSFPMWVKSKQ